MKKNFGFKFLSLILVFACVASAVACLSFGGQNGVANAISDSVHDNMITDAWYLGENQLNIEALRVAMSKIDKSKYEKDPMIIAVIDTGINYTHEVFGIQNDVSVLLSDSKGDIECYNSDLGSSALADVVDKHADGHGTGTTSTIAGLIYELSLEKYVKIYPIKASNSKDSFPVESVIRAIKRADEIGADVINLSLGLLKYSKSGFSRKENSDWTQNTDLISAIKSTDAVVVAAAGNQKTSSTSNPFYPASFDGVLSVMAHTDTNIKYVNSNYGNYDIIAPGLEIKVANKTGNSAYKEMSGTSLASPIVSFACALLKMRLEQMPDFGNDVDKNIVSEFLIESATASINYDSKEYPKLNIYNALSRKFDIEDIEFAEPTGLELSDDGTMENFVVTEKLDKVKKIKFVASLVPVGRTDPRLNSNILWYIRQSEETPFADWQQVASGKDFFFTPTGGTYQLVVRYKGNGFESERVVDFDISYVVPYGEDVKVVRSEQKHMSADEADNNIFIYSNESVTVALTGLKFTDPNTEIKWFVNGQEKGKGAEFEFKPNSQSGKYTITAEYGGRVVTFDNQMTITTASVLTHPAVAIGLGVGAMMLIVVSVCVVVYIKSRKSEVEIEFGVYNENEEDIAE